MVYAPSGSWLLLIGMVIVWLVGFATGIVSCVIYKEIKDLNLKPLRQALNKEKIKIKNN